MPLEYHGPDALPLLQIRAIGQGRPWRKTYFLFFFAFAAWKVTFSFEITFAAPGAWAWVTVR